MKKSSVVIVIPAYNEGLYLEKNVEIIRRTLQEQKVPFLWQILIGEDSSTDNTLQVARQLARKYRDVKAFHFQLRSKDETIKQLWMQSKADVYLFTDADNSADPRFIPELVHAILEGYDLAIGQRFTHPENSRGFYRDMLSMIYNQILLPIILPTGTSDTQCGFKAVSRKVVNIVVPRLGKENGFFDSELLAVSRCKGYRVKEMPIIWRETRKSVLSVHKNIPNFLRNMIKTRWKMMRGYYD